jgi:anti-sigma B factor antagonist
MEFHEDDVARAGVIGKYLHRRLDADTAEAFERHYLGCDECFEELRATGLLVAGLMAPALDRRHIGEVACVGFRRPVQLTRASRNLSELSEGILEQKDTKVLIDLSRVSRIDSAGLGLLMACYSHTVRQRGTLKLLRPSLEIQNLLRMTKVDSVLEFYDDEKQALQSFQTP